MLSDPKGEVISAYGLADRCLGDDVARPAAFVLDAEGVVRWRHLPESWRVRLGAEDYRRALVNAGGLELSLNDEAAP